MKKFTFKNYKKIQTKKTPVLPVLTQVDIPIKVINEY